MGTKLTEHRTFGENIYGAFGVYITKAGHSVGKFCNYLMFENAIPDTEIPPPPLLNRPGS